MGAVLFHEAQQESQFTNIFIWKLSKTEVSLEGKVLPPENYQLPSTSHVPLTYKTTDPLYNVLYSRQKKASSLNIELVHLTPRQIF